MLLPGSLPVVCVYAMLYNTKLSADPRSACFSQKTVRLACDTLSVIVRRPTARFVAAKISAFRKPYLHIRESQLCL